MTDFATLRIEVEDRIATVWLNRPDKLNALNSEIRRELIEALDGLAEREDVGAVILTGSGDRAFAAGADVAEFAERSVEEQRAISEGRRIFETVADFPKPIVAAVHGFCLGGGCELALACDFRIADPTARFGQPEVRIGLIPGGGGTQRLVRLVGYGHAMRIVLTGDFIDAEEAHRIGLAEFLVAEGEHVAKAREICGRMLRWKGETLRLAKQALRAAQAGLAEGVERERELFLEAFGSEAGRAGVRAFVEGK